MAFPRQWDGTAWQEYSLRLAQVRHGAENVQQVPDKVRGDCGIEFFALNGCLYQCYAPEEVYDIQKAASGMKTKSLRDLKKLEDYKDTIADILQSTKARRWILLCPFLDDKEVVAYVREKGEKIRAAGLPFISDDFEALVHSQSDFEGEIEQLRLRALGPALKLTQPTDEQITSSSESALGKRLREKLDRAYPGQTRQQMESRANAYIRSLLLRDNALDDLRRDQPILWERSTSCLDAEERRLAAFGSNAARPSAQLRESVDRIEKSLKEDLKDLPQAAITSMSTGTVGDWLMRCPLDFPAKDES
jgi:hypothetical protein